MTPLRLRFVFPLLLCLVLSGMNAAAASGAEKRLKVLTSTFPVYQITRNVVQGIAAIEVDLMIPADMGCPHDYALIPQDMRKLATADVLVVNGLGLEEFLGAPVRKANPAILVIDSSRGIDQLLYYQDEVSGERGSGHGKDDHHGEGEQPHGHDKGQVNPHLFTSPRMIALMATTIAKGLAERLPAEANLLAVNARAYAERMRALADDLAGLGRGLGNKRIVTQHGVFDYLARDMGLEVVAVVQAHAGQDPSAAEILDLIATIRSKQAGAVFTEPQYPQSLGQTIAREAGIPATTLDPVATGPEPAPLDYSEQVMRANMKVLEQTLGRR